MCGQAGGRVCRAGVYGGDYCDTEVFRAECSDGEVIIMRKALYGRLKIGRCVEIDLGYIGCFRYQPTLGRLLAPRARASFSTRTWVRTHDLLYGVLGPSHLWIRPTKFSESEPKISYPSGHFAINVSWTS